MTIQIGSSVTVSVHARLDAPGFLVRLVSGRRISKFPTATIDEANSLAESIKKFIQLGLPVETLLGEAATTT